MYKTKGDGLGNILIKLAEVRDGYVSKDIYDGHRDKFLKFKHVTIVYDDSMEQIKPSIYINPPRNIKFVDMVEPTEYTKLLIEKYRHLVNDVSYAINIRRGSLSSSEYVVRYSNNTVFCDDDSLQEFINIVETSKGNVFIASDCLETKRKFTRMFPGRITCLEEEPDYIIGEGGKEPWVSFVEFFLLSMCPYIVLTGGNKDMYSFSTFGYCAALYGNVPYKAIFNKT